MMGLIKPFAHWISLQGVDHDDAMFPLEDDSPATSHIARIFGIPEEEMRQPQGIGAGVIIATGQTAGELLKPGFKVYYDTRFARKIDEIWVVDVRAVIAYEEL